MGEKVKVGPKFQVVIPRSIRRKVPLVPRMQVLVEEVNGAIIILPEPKSFTKFMFGRDARRAIVAVSPSQALKKVKK